MDDLLLKKLKSEYQYLRTEKEYQEQVFRKAEKEFKDHAMFIFMKLQGNWVSTVFQKQQKDLV